MKIAFSISTKFKYCYLILSNVSVAFRSFIRDSIITDPSSSVIYWTKVVQRIEFCLWWGNGWDLETVENTFRNFTALEFDSSRLIDHHCWNRQDSNNSRYAGWFSSTPSRFRASGISPSWFKLGCSWTFQNGSSTSHYWHLKTTVVVLRGCWWLLFPKGVATLHSRISWTSRLNVSSVPLPLPIDFRLGPATKRSSTYKTRMSSFLYLGSALYTGNNRVSITWRPS